MPEPFENKYATNKNYREFRDNCHYTGEHRDAAHNICNLKYSLFKEIKLIFQTGSDYDFYFIIRRWKFKGQLNCSG